MVARALKLLDVNGLEVLIIENVGNLVCPASYDLGEDLRVVLMSVTEGEDKPLKYPKMFKTADIVLISKTDLATAVGFDRATALDKLLAVVSGDAVDQVLARCCRHAESRHACCIGTVQEAQDTPFIVRGALEAIRVLDEPSGAPLPRIC